MKTSGPGPRTTLRFQKLLFQFLGFVILAVVVWLAQDFIASFAATEVQTVTTLRTTEEKNDERVLRAFRTAQQSLHIPAARLATEPNPEQRTRDATLTITGKTKREVLDARGSLVGAMRAEFVHGGPGELFDVGSAPHATPVENKTMATVRQACRGLSLALALGGMAFLLLQWKRSHLPKGALLGILAYGLTMVLTMKGDDEGGGITVWLLVAGLPIAFLGLIGYVTARVRRVATWQEGVARITQSKVEVARHRFTGDTTKVRNVASVAYTFKANGQTVQGDRISVGIAPADNVDQVLKRYPVGAEVPVFFDPANPKECVLEGKPPVSLGCLWTGAIIVVLVYAVAVVCMMGGKSVDQLLAATLPGVRHPFVVMGAGLLGLLSLASGIYFRLHPRKAFPWARTQGVIVSSIVESYFDDASSSGSSQRRYYKAVVEYSYTVEGHEYHNTLDAGSVMNISVSTTNPANAQSTADRYPTGQPVDVFYDPQNPTRSALNVNTEMVLNGNASLIMGVILLAVAWYAAGH